MEFPINHKLATDIEAVCDYLGKISKYARNGSHREAIEIAAMALHLIDHKGLRKELIQSIVKFNSPLSEEEKRDLDQKLKDMRLERNDTADS